MKVLLEFPTQPAFRTVRQQNSLKKSEEGDSSVFFSAYCCLTVLKAGCVGNSNFKVAGSIPAGVIGIFY